MADPDADPASYATVTGFERANLVAFMVVIQAAQVLLMAGGVLVFFLLFGALTMGVDVQSAWTGLERDEITKLPYLVQVSVPLGKGCEEVGFLAVSAVKVSCYDMREMLCLVAHRTVLCPRKGASLESSDARGTSSPSGQGPAAAASCALAAAPLASHDFCT